MPRYVRTSLTSFSLDFAFLPENHFFGIISHSKKEYNRVSKMFRKLKFFCILCFPIVMHRPDGSFFILVYAFFSRQNV